jgi:transcriptional regulator with XRE-family HTH domain
MANIKEILAANLKENRRKKGLTQEKLAELADMSLHYLAIIELANNFPSGEMLEKLAKALDIQAYELFYPIAAPEGTMHHLEQSIIANIENVVRETVKQSVSTAVKESFAEECNKLTDATRL